jgi:trans-2,3-dihydro-3-hydroxyanthranilate isomerase
MKRKNIRIKQVDTFTTSPFSGNPAVVVMEADGLTDEEMLLIARETNAAGAVFVMASGKTEADFHLRFFTLNTEIDLCTHAAVAAFHALIEDGRIWPRKAKMSVLLETGTGLLPVEMVFENCRLQNTMITQALPRFKPADLEADKIANILNIPLPDIGDTGMPIESAFTGLWHLIIPVNNMRSFSSLSPDYDRLENINRQHGILSIQLFCMETVEKDSIVHTRNFTPATGIRENAVAGDANGALGCYLVKNGVVEVPTGKVILVAEQGIETGRPGKVDIEITVMKEKITAVRVGGTAVTVMDGVMRL